MVLLASGGHCILAIVEDVDKFFRLGETKDIAPGEAFDKVSFTCYFVGIILMFAECTGNEIT